MTVAKLTALAARLMFMAALLLVSSAPAVAQDATPLPENGLPQRICGKDPSGLIVYVPVDDAGVQAPGLNVADPSTGKIVASLDIPKVDLLVPLRAPGKAVASTEDGRKFLINAMEATASELIVPAGTGQLFEWTRGLPLGVGTHWTILSDGWEQFLLNIENGSLINVHSLLPQGTPEINFYSVLAPDENSAIIGNGGQYWLVPINQPQGIRSLSLDTVESMSSYGSYSSDGNFVIYSRSPATGNDSELVVEPTDGSTPPEVIGSADRIFGVFVPGSDLIASYRYNYDGKERTTEIVLVDRVLGQERVLLTRSDSPIELIASPDGNHLLAISSSDDASHYTDIDLNTGKALELPVLDDLLLFGVLGSPWRLATPLIGSSDVAPFPGFYSVDLRAGKATILAPITLGNGVKITSPIFSKDGTSAMSATYGPEGQALWVFDLVSGTGTAVHEGAFTGADLSPDGCWFVIGDLSGSGAETRATITVQQVEGDVSVSLGEGRKPVWVDR